MASEREMLLGKGGKGDRQLGIKVRRRGRWWKLTLSIGAALVVLVVGAGWLLGPGIAAGLIEREIPVAMGSGSGRVIVRDVSLRWGGPQRVGSVIVENAFGEVIADLDAVMSAPLLGAYLDRDVGTITISGLIDITEEDAMALAGGERASGDAPALGSAPTARSEVRLPTGWSGAVQTRGLQVFYEGEPVERGGVGKLEVKGLDILASYTGGAEAEISIEAESPEIEVKASARRLADASGVPTLGESEIDMVARGRLPEALLDVALRQVTGARTTEAPGAPSMGGESAVFELEMEVRDGRLRLADSSKPGFAQVPMTAGLAGLIQESSGVSFIDRPGARATLQELDFPAESLVGRGDWRDARLNVVVETSVGSVAGDVDDDGRDERIEMLPGGLAVRSQDIASGVEVGGEASLVVDGRDAGRLQLNINTGALADDRGSLETGSLAGLEGHAIFEGLPTSIVQAFVPDTGIDLSETLGSSLSVRLSASTSDSDDLDELVTLIECEAGATFFGASFVAQATATELRLPEQAIFVELDNPGPAVRALLGPEAPRVAGSGTLIAQVQHASMPLVGWLPDFRRASAEARVAIGELSLAEGPLDGVLEFSSLDTEVRLTPEQPLRVLLDWRARYGAESFRATGDFLGSDAWVEREGSWPWLDPALEDARFDGTLEVTDLPAALLLAGDSAIDDAARRATGRTIRARLNVEGASLDGRGGFELEALSETGAELLARMTSDDPARVRVTELSAQGELTPDVLGTLLSDAGLEGTTLEQAARVRADAEPFVIEQPIVGLESIARITASVRLLGDAVISQAGERDATLGVRDARLIATLDRESAESGGARLEAGLFVPWQAGEVGSVIAEAALPVGDDGSIGVVPREADVTLLDVASVDQALALESMLVELLGSRAELSLEPVAGGESGSARFGLISDRTNAEGSLRIDSERIELLEPVSAQLRVSPRTATRLASGLEGFEVSELSQIDVNVDELSVGLRGTPLKPGVFGVDARVEAESVGLRTPEGESVAFQGVALEVSSSGLAAGAIGFDLSVRTVDENSEPAFARGRIEGLADASGALADAGQTVWLDAGGMMLSRHLDIVAGTDGLIAELLGPTAEVTLDAAGLSRASGTLSAEVRGPGAEGAVAGRMTPEGFVSEAPAGVTLREISYEFSRRVFQNALPIVGSLSKSPEDAPSVMTARSFSVPLDGDLRKLDAEINVDLGTLEFSTSGALSDLLRVTRNRAEGQLGRRVEPFDVSILDGVASFADVELPIGEFLLQTRGTVDIAGRTMDLVLFVPVGALSDEVASGLGGSGLSVGRMSSVPFRIQGGFDDAKVNLAPDLIPEGLIPGLIEEGSEGLDEDEKQILEGIGRLLEGIGKNKRR